MTSLNRSTPDAKASGRRPTRTNELVNDLIAGVKSYPIWMAIGWQDVKQRYRRSVLGPFWVTISLAVLVGSLGLLYGSLFKQDMTTYLPYLALGFVFWTVISAIIIESTTIFEEGRELMLQLPLPISTFAFRLLWRNLIVLAHNLVVFVFIWLIYPQPLGLSTLTVLPAIILLMLNGLWVVLLVGTISVRFRDLGPIVQSAVQISFFLTPILWKPDLLEGRKAIILALNPFHHMIRIFRDPLLGQPVPWQSWGVMLALLVAGGALTTLVVGRYRKRIAYWL